MFTSLKEYEQISNLNPKYEVDKQKNALLTQKYFFKIFNRTHTEL